MRGDLTPVCSYVIGVEGKGRESQSSWLHAVDEQEAMNTTQNTEDSNEMQGSCFFLTMRAFKPWNRFPREAVEPPSLEILKK